MFVLRVTCDHDVKYAKFISFDRFIDCLFNERDKLCDNRSLFMRCCRHIDCPKDGKCDSKFSYEIFISDQLQKNYPKDGLICEQMKLLFNHYLDILPKRKSKTK